MSEFKLYAKYWFFEVVLLVLPLESLLSSSEQVFFYERERKIKFQEPSKILLIDPSFLSWDEWIGSVEGHGFFGSLKHGEMGEIKRNKEIFKEHDVFSQKFNPIYILYSLFDSFSIILFYSPFTSVNPLLSLITSKIYLSTQQVSNHYKKWKNTQ